MAITVNETVPHSPLFARSENFGPNHQGIISVKSARALCGMYPLPKIGYETVCAMHACGPGARLYVANISGTFVVRSPSVPVDAWPQVFGVTLVRKTV